MKTETAPLTETDIARVRDAIAQIQKDGEKVTRRRVQQMARIDMRVVIPAMKAIEADSDPSVSIAPQVRALADKFVADVTGVSASVFEGRLAAADAERDEALGRAVDAEAARHALNERQTAIIAGHLEALNSVQAEKEVLAERLNRAEAELAEARIVELELRSSNDCLNVKLITARATAAKARGKLEAFQSVLEQFPQAAR
ncbi:MAG: hypothetical protein ACOYMS_11255 [Terrimicrobiaceae bacterium]